MTATASLCSTCYREIEARLFIDGGAVMMRKTCPVHGETVTMVERDAAFWRACQQSGGGFSVDAYGQMSLVEVTDRCNLSCAHCYHQPDNSRPDRSADWVVAKALAAPTRHVCLMGAEPTMRDDLPQVLEGIRAGGKVPSIYTNGVRLADRDRLSALMAGGLHSASLSLHGPNYHGAKVFSKVAAALDGMVAAGLPLGQVSFMVNDLGEGLNAALRRILDLAAAGVRPVDFCLRSPGRIGRAPQGEQLFVSDLFAALNRLAVERGLSLEIMPAAGNNPHHVRVDFCGTPIQLVHWPDAGNIDLRFMNMGPWASFVDGTYGAFALQAILRDGLKQGWWQGRRLIDA